MKTEKREIWETRFLWRLMVVLTIATAVGLWKVGLSLDQLALRNSILKFFGVLAAFIVFRYFKANNRFTNFLHIASVLWAYTAITLILSYVVTAAHFPLFDAPLLRMDEMLHFDWLGFFRWVEMRPAIHTGLVLAYDSFVPQMIFLQIVLNWQGHGSRAWELTAVAVLSCIVCVLLSGVWPALGPFDHFQTEPNAPNIRDIIELRNGTLTVVGSRAVQGLVEFPSFHAASAVFYTYAARSMPDLFPFVLVLNTIMIVSTLPIGGHYLTDSVAGAVVAVAVIGIVHMLGTRRRKEA